MKNQNHQDWLWKILIVTALYMTIGASHAFADASKCANPTEVNLGPRRPNRPNGLPKGQVIIKFCDIPAAQGVVIGSENGEENEKPLNARNFKKFQMAQFEVTQSQF